jgi:hypothetical protein
VRYISLPDEFDEVYRTQHSYFGGYQGLGGGLSVSYSPAGILLVAAAADEALRDVPVELLVTMIGQAKGASPLPTWKRLILEARLAAHTAPALTTIHAVSALDTFVEEFTGQMIVASRPGSWNTAVRHRLGTSVRDLMGKSYFRNLEKLVQVRNQLAHGTEYLDRLPQTLQQEELRWRDVGKFYEGEAAIPPSTEFALRTALTAIRVCQRAASVIS